MALPMDRLNAVLLNLDESEQRRVSDNLGKFCDTLDTVVTVDYRGTAVFDEAAVRAAVGELRRDTFYAVPEAYADGLISDLRSGFMALGQAGALLPVSYLQRDDVVSRFSSEWLQQLAAATPQPDMKRLDTSLQLPNLTLPTEKLAEVSGKLNEALREQLLFESQLRSRMEVAQLQPPILKLRRKEEEEEIPPGPGPGPGGGGSSLPSIISMVTEFVNDCMPGSSIVRPRGIWRGVGVCMDEHCARLLVRILRRLGAGSILANAVQAGWAAGSIGAAWSAAVSTAGGVVTLVIAICIEVFATWLNSCITAQGVCIHWPWWAGFGPVPYARR